MRPAHAQGGGLLPVRVKLGILNLQDGRARDLGGNPLFLGEVDLALPSRGSGRTIFSLGYQERRGNGGLLRVVPITAAQVFSLPNPGAAVTGNVYYGLGVGAYILRGTDNGASENKTTFGGFGVVGYQTPVAYFVEAKYQLVAGKVQGARPSGVLLAVGRRF